MAQAVKAPVNQKRHTNVVTVRLKKAGFRFEVACYPNKVLSWRDGNEEDIDEVLQTDSLFSNVSKGILAKSEELTAAFGNMEHMEIIRHILLKGELQVSGKERQARQTLLFRDIANIIVDKCVDTSNYPLPISFVERCMHESHVSVSPNRSAKQQALEIIHQLQQKGVPIVRAQMRVLLEIPVDNEQEQIPFKFRDHDTVHEKSEYVRDESQSLKYVATCKIGPGSFRSVEEAVRADGGSVKVLDLQVVQDGEQGIEATQQKLSALSIPDSVDGGSSGGGSGSAPNATKTPPTQQPTANKSRRRRRRAKKNKQQQGEYQDCVEE